MGKRKEETARDVMQGLRSVDYRQLMWKQVAFGAREFELRAGDDLVGRLYWPKWLSDRAVARCADGVWLIDRLGFFRDKIVVTDMGSRNKVGSFVPNWLGDGRLSLINGRVYQWYKTKAFSNSWAFVDKNDVVLLEIHDWMRCFKHEADVKLRIGAASLPELTLLVLIGWYLVYMYIQDTAAVVAACVAAT
ncbi:MAG: hypothetical protein AMJ88_03690 [Anaerolineae bacterium SM23_ 63]|nr:MAG: hypothetical protein AMJ88_03690 [Anaerolineae bacterium SM23_ 63]HEY45929.1 hypothetical protein [Anaerolineae bacterium]